LRTQLAATLVQFGDYSLLHWLHEDFSTSLMHLLLLFYPTNDFGKHGTITMTSMALDAICTRRFETVDNHFL